MNRVLPLVVTLGFVVTPAAPALGGSDGPLDDAREVMQRVPFRGRLTIAWTDAGAPRTASIGVRGGDGVVTIDGATDAVASGTRRLLRHGDAWDLLWPGGLAGAPPGVQRKYSMSRSAGPVVAGRSTELVEVREGSVVRERLALDTETGLLLQREQLASDGSTVRRLVFETIEIGTPPPPHPDAGHVMDVRPLKVSLPAPYSAPKRLGAGYERVGVYRHGGVVHVLYSDGLYGLSVFEQAGRLDRSAMPAGESVPLGPRTGHRYTWAGGHVVLWQAGPTAWTVVGDGPEDQILAAARSLPAAPAISLSQRLRQECRRLVEALSGRS